MAEANLQPVPQLVIDLSGDQGTITQILKVASDHLMQHGYPAALIEEMFDKVMTASSYSSALVTLWACTGCRYILNGRPVDYLTCGHGTAERLIAGGDVYPAGRAH